MLECHGSATRHSSDDVGLSRRVKTAGALVCWVAVGIHPRGRQLVRGVGGVRVRSSVR